MSFGSPMLADRNPDLFIEDAVQRIREVVGDRFAVAAVSGGVDSAVAAFIGWLALDGQLHAVFIDTGYMREGEGAEVKRLFGKVGLPVEVIDRGERFYEATFGLCDAEAKRKAMRETFYTVLSSYVRSVGASFLIQGTIAPDWIETVGGIKTQHNVLYQVGIKPEERYGFTVIEPLANLYKSQVRVLARHLGLPEELLNRQPFPGPGLLVRCVGCCSREKLSTLKKVTKLVEDGMRGLGASQYFAAIFSAGVEDPSISLGVGGVKAVYRFPEKATGVKGDVREYGFMVGVSGDVETLYRRRLDLLKELNRMRGYTRMLLMIGDGGSGRYAVAVRAVVTSDYMTADVLDVDPNFLVGMGESILRVKGVSQVFYDITPKPPATIEFE